MKRILIVSLGVLLLTSSLATAEYRDDHRYRQGQGHEWRRGEYIDRGEWRHAGRVDYRDYHLRRPPYGYEWRAYDGNWVLAAIATGVIADIIINAR